MLFCCISTHAPLAGRDRSPSGRTPPRMYFNPRAPCGARLKPGLHAGDDIAISTHAPLAGRDGFRRGSAVFRYISTHAPLAGRDCLTFPPCTCTADFNPRAPCGARLVGAGAAPAPRIFQPTRPLRGATASPRRGTSAPAYFNPRAPCGARPRLHPPGAGPHDFNPRAPCGARLWFSICSTLARIFQPTRPLRGATFFASATTSSSVLFQPTRPLRGATMRGGTFVT